MKTKRWLQIGLVLVIAAGCARTDWIEGTLVTVDVTGQWGGKWSNGGGDQVEMTLRQTGPKVTGDFRMTGADAHFWSGPIVGTVKGDVLTFGRDELRGEVIVAGDEMSGTATFTSSGASACCPGVSKEGTKTLRLQRQP
jgi:hypothetical protein